MKQVLQDDGRRINGSSSSDSLAITGDISLLLSLWSCESYLPINRRQDLQHLRPSSNLVPQGCWITGVAIFAKSSESRVRHTSDVGSPRDGDYYTMLGL